MKGFIRLASMAIFSSFLFAAFSANAQNDVKFQILQIQEEIQQNQDNPNYDKAAAERRLVELKATYSPEKGKQINADQPSTETTVSKQQTPVTYENRKEAAITEKKALIDQMRVERESAIKAGQSTEKYDHYIKKYEEAIQQLEKEEGK